MSTVIFNAQYGLEKYNFANPKCPQPIMAQSASEPSSAWLQSVTVQFLHTVLKGRGGYLSCLPAYFVADTRKYNYTHAALAYTSF